MGLVERLGFQTLDNLYSTLDGNEIIEWAAYDLTKDPEWRKKTETAIALEQQKGQTAEDEAARIRTMFAALGHKA